MRAARAYAYITTAPPLMSHGLQAYDQNPLHSQPAVTACLQHRPLVLLPRAQAPLKPSSLRWPLPLPLPLELPLIWAFRIPRAKLVVAVVVMAMVLLLHRSS